MNRLTNRALILVLAAAWLYASSAAMQTAAVDSKAKAFIAAATTPQAQLTDLDTFMARVLERRNENWRTLHDYILSEREEFQILGPGDIVLLGQRRDFLWFIRDGYLVRSPVKANGATLGEDARRKYEADWLDKEKKREQNAKDKAVKKDSVAAEVAKEIASEDPGPEKDITSLAGGGWYLRAPLVQLDVDVAKAIDHAWRVHVTAGLRF